MLERELSSIAKVYKTNFAEKSRASVPLALLRRTLYRACSVAMQASDLAIERPSDDTIAFCRRSREREYVYETEEQAVSEEQARRNRR